jgi:spermidine/putrescine transport system substrate-binding protein
MKPVEGRYGWVCGLSVVKGSPNRDLAHDYIDAWLTAPSGAWLISNYYYGHSNQQSIPQSTGLTPDIINMMGIGDPDLLDKSHFPTNDFDVVRYQQEWQQIKAAD